MGQIFVAFSEYLNFHEFKYLSCQKSYLKTMVRASIVFVFPFQAFSLDVVTKGFDNILFAFDIELEKNGKFEKKSQRLRSFFPLALRILAVFKVSEILSKCMIKNCVSLFRLLLFSLLSF